MKLFEFWGLGFLAVVLFFDLMVVRKRKSMITEAIVVFTVTTVKRSWLIDVLWMGWNMFGPRRDLIVRSVPVSIRVWLEVWP